MSKTSIEWTDAVWNPARGCSRISRGCERCYAEVIASRFSGPGQPFAGFAGSPWRYSSRDGHMKATGQRFGWTGKVALIPEKLSEPLHWRKPRRVFVNSMSDLFHEKLSFPDIASVFGIMASARQHTFQVLTKRPERMREWFVWISGRNDELNLIDTHADEALLEAGHATWKFSMPGGTAWPLPNVWLGVSVEDQKTADERIPILLQAPAAIRFVSQEPALGPVDLSGFMSASGFVHEDEARTVKPFDLAFVNGEPGHDPWLPSLSWVIVGGESGPKARPFDLAWARSTVTQCRRAGVPVFVKQLGARRVDSTVFPNSEEPGSFGAILVDGYNSGVTAKQLERIRDRAGADPSEWPEALRVREFPEVSHG